MVVTIWQLDLQLPMQSVPIKTQKNIVSDLQQVPPPQFYTAIINFIRSSPLIRMAYVEGTVYDECSITHITGWSYLIKEQQLQSLSETFQLNFFEVNCVPFLLNIVIFKHIYQ